MIRLIAIGVIVGLLLTMVAMAVPAPEPYYDALGDRHVEFPGRQSVGATGSYLDVKLDTNAVCYSSYYTSLFDNRHTDISMRDYYDPYGGELADYRERILFKLPKIQAELGTVEKVEIHLRYASNQGRQSPGGRLMRLRSVTRSASDVIPLEANAMEYQSGSQWTTFLGDVTSASQTSFYHPETIGWWIIDATWQATTAWDAGNDWVGVLMFSSETRVRAEQAWPYYYGSTGGANAPFMRVYYTEEVLEPPTVSTPSTPVTHSETSVTVWVQGVLRDFAEGEMQLQVSVHDANTWNKVSSLETITTTTQTQHTVTGLSPDTQYDYRGALKYDDGGETWKYGIVYTFTTQDWTRPTFSIAKDSATLGTLTVEWGWTGNTDNASIETGVSAIRHDPASSIWWRSWYALGTSTAENWSDTFEFTVEPGDIQYKVRAYYKIFGTTYWSDSVVIDCYTHGTMVVSLDSVGTTHAHILTVWTLGDLASWDNIEVWLQKSGTTAKIGLETITVGLDGSGNHTVEFDGLSEGTKYIAYADATHSGGTLEAVRLSFYTSSVTDEPLAVMGDCYYVPQARQMWLEAGVNMRDAFEYEASVAFQYRKRGESSFIETAPLTITRYETGSHDYGLGVAVPGVFEWSTEYEVWPVVRWAGEEVTGDVKLVMVPDREVGFYDLTAEVRGRNVVLTAMCDFGEGVTKDVYWMAVNQETFEATYSPSLSMQHGHRVGWEVSLDGETEYMASIHIVGQEWVWATISFETDESMLGWMEDVISPWVDMTTVLLIAAMVVIVAVGGVLFWKLRGRGGVAVGTVGMIGAMVIFASLGWIPGWMIVLLSVGMALALLFLIKGSGLAGAGGE